MLKRFIASILVTQIILCQFIFAQQRGVAVKVKKDNGQVEEVQLYKESHALIIGVSDYTNGWKSLPGVKTDVTAVSAALKANGFAVRELINPTRNQLFAGIDSFINDFGYGTGNRLLIYFAGHGHTQKAADGRDLGYIVPTDAPLPTANELLFRRTALSMNEIDNYARRIEAKHALFIFDSCFSGSLLTKRRSNIPPIITLKTTQPVRQFITAGADDQEVPDVSIFRQQFVEGLKGEADLNNDGYITGSELADYLQEKVGNYTRLSQTPQYGKIFDPLLDKGDFVFVSPKKEVMANSSNSSNDANRIENEFWEAIKNNKDVGAFRLYKEKYPNGIYTNLADLKIRQLTISSDQPKNQPLTSTPNVNVGVMNSRAIVLPKPAYPAEAKKEGASGQVIVQISVDENGNVISAQAIGGHQLLRAPAESAARSSKFNPVKIGGKAVKATGTLVYNFINQ